MKSIGLCIILTLVSLSLSSAEPAFKPGLAASMNFDIIEQAKDVYLQYLLKNISNSPMDDIEYEGGHLK